MLFFTLPFFLMGKAIAKRIESTPHRLRYELTTIGAPNEVTVITNSGAPSPDLRTDNSPPAGAFVSPLRALINAHVMDQKQARAVLSGHQNVIGAPTVTRMGRARMTITARTAPTEVGPITIPVWVVDANEGAAAGDPASAGRAVVVVQGPPIADYTAELEIFVPHSYET
jgi:hypothetical protein